MTIEDRARKLVGDMPWVTENLTNEQINDLIKQIQTCLQVAIDEHYYDAIRAEAFD